MRAFRQSGAHKEAMPKLSGWCSESSTVHWEQLQMELPDWLDAHQRMITEGREYPVDRRSASFDLRGIPKPRMPALRVHNFAPIKA